MMLYFYRLYFVFHAQNNNIFSSPLGFNLIITKSKIAKNEFPKKFYKKI